MDEMTSLTKKLAQGIESLDSRLSSRNHDDVDSRIDLLVDLELVQLRLLVLVCIAEGAVDGTAGQPYEVSRRPYEKPFPLDRGKDFRH